MKKIIRILLVVVIGLGGVVYADDVSKMAELNTKMDQLNRELSELTLKIQSVMTDLENDKRNSDPEKQKSQNSKETSSADKEKLVTEMQKAIVKISNDQVELTKEIKKVKDRVVPHTISNDEMDQVYVGESNSGNAAVLYNYGDANEAGRDVRYVDDDNDDYYVPSGGYQFYFGEDPDYYEAWEGPWAIDPPYWLRRKEYWRK